MSKAGIRILTSARQALAYATGEADTSQYSVHVPEHLDVRAIRQKIRMSQEELARHFGVHKRIVQDWEQGAGIHWDQHEHSSDSSYVLDKLTRPSCIRRWCQPQQPLLLVRREV